MSEFDSSSTKSYECKLYWIYSELYISIAFNHGLRVLTLWASNLHDITDFWLQMGIQRKWNFSCSVKWPKVSVTFGRFVMQHANKSQWPGRRPVFMRDIQYIIYSYLLIVFRLFANASVPMCVKVDLRQLLNFYVTNGEFDPKICLKSGAKKVRLEQLLGKYFIKMI